MIKVIAKKTYSTEDSALILQNIHGFFGDPKGYEECLYQTKDGAYFLYLNGGAESIHPKEEIKRISAFAAEKWISEVKD
ncbi:MAG: hypothetical protein MJ078_04125 [Clostridia bacterium]|nr:hypothetical protein [Clostridia bacterium]